MVLYKSGGGVTGPFPRNPAHDAHNAHDAHDAHNAHDASAMHRVLAGD
jgi:hypothetical protein